jgi:hypothetical protein
VLQPPVSPAPTDAPRDRASGITLRGIVTFSGIDYGLAQAETPMAGAAVYTEGLPALRTRTGSEGRFALTGVPRGEHHVVAETLVGCSMLKVRAPASATEDVPVADMQGLVLRRTGSLVGVVALPDDESDVLGADVFVAGTTLIAKAKANGAFALADIAEGVYDVTATLPGYRPSTTRVSIKAGRSAEARFALERAAPEEIAGAPHWLRSGPRGAVLAGAAVSSQGPVSLTALSDASGRFAFANVPPGDTTWWCFTPHTPCSWSSERSGLPPTPK